jgi:IS5 family transposase
MKALWFVTFPHKNRIFMIKKVPSATNRDLFRTLLSDLINPKHEPALPADKIDWSYFENEFKGFYSEKPSRPAMPIRLMVGVLMLKYLYSLGDEKISFAGKATHTFSIFAAAGFSSTNSPAIRVILYIFASVGEAGVEKIFAYNVKLHGEAVPVHVKFVLSDTTVQGNFTTFPTDAKLCKK